MQALLELRQFVEKNINALNRNQLQGDTGVNPSLEKHRIEKRTLQRVLTKIHWLEKEHNLVADL